MGDLYSAGRVGVDVVPDLTGFRRELDAKLRTLLHGRSLDVNANIRADATAYNAMAKRIDGRTLTNTVRVVGDASGLKSINRQLADTSRRFEGTTFTPKLDTGEWAQDIDRLVRDTSEKFAKLDGTMPYSLGPSARAAAESEKRLKNLTDFQNQLADAQERYNKAAAEASGKQLEQLSKTIDDMQSRVAKAQEDVERRNTQYEASMRRLVERQNQATDAQEKYNKAVKEVSDRQIAQLAKTVETLQSRVAKAQEDVERRNTRQEASMARLTARQNQLNEAQEKYNRAVKDGATEKQLANLSKHVDTFKSRVENAQAALDHSSGQRETSLKKLTDYQKQLADAQEKYNKAVKDGVDTTQMKRIAQLSKHVDTFKSRVESAQKTLDRSSEQQEKSLARLTDFQKQLADAQERYNKVSKEGASTAEMRKLTEQMDALKAHTEQAREGVRGLYKEFNTVKFGTPPTAEWDEYFDKVTGRKYDRTRPDVEYTGYLKPKVEELDTVLNRFRNRLETPSSNAFLKGVDQQVRTVLKNQRALDRQLSQDIKNRNAITKATREYNWGLADTAKNTGDAKDALADYRRQAAEANGLLDEMEGTLGGLSDAFDKFNPFGGRNADIAKQVDDALRSIRAMRTEIERNPINAKLVLDDGDFNREIAEATYKATNLSRQLEKEHDLDVRISGIEDAARELEELVFRMNHQRVDIPVEWNVDTNELINRLHRLAGQVSLDPSVNWEAQADLDLDLRRAKERIEDFQDKYDKLDMDLDLQTRLARAHLAWFTRPRTIDIYASFKGTDLGKIVNGMTAGATGLDYVNNQFRKLVNLMDSLDTVIPKWSLLGSVLLSIGAGATNLASTIGGIGSSIVTMSKAALAAPAAVGGLASAFVAGRWALSTLTDEFDVASTQLAGMSDAVGDAAWERFGDTMYEMADTIAPTLGEGLTAVAISEGNVAANLMGIVQQNDKISELAGIFVHTATAVDYLNPGMESLVSALLTLGDETSVYLPRMASYFSEVADSFAGWVREAQATGAITDALEKAIEQGGYLMSSLKSLKGIIEGTFGTLAKYENGIQGFSEALESANQAVNSWKFQDVLESLIDGAQTAQDTVRDSFSDIGDDLWSLRDEMGQAFEDAGTIVASVLSNISELLADSGDGISDFTSGLASGWSKAMDAVGDSGPAFSDMLSMVGQLADTFGGTFASGLRVAGPLLSSIAKVAETVAEAFDSLPEPLKQASALYMTFGRAGQQALDSIKMGMLNNIIQTAQYQQSLNQLGLSADNMSTSLFGVTKAWAATKGLNVTGTLNSMNAGMTATGNAMQNTAGKTGILNTALTGVKNALGAIGVTTGITLLLTALSDFVSRGQQTEQAAQKIGDALADAGSVATSAAEGVDTVSESMTDMLTEGEALEGGLNWLSDWRTGFDSAAEAAAETKVSVTDLVDAIQGGESTYESMRETLQGLVNDGTVYSQTASGVMVASQTENAKAAQKQLESLEALRDEYRDQVVQVAEANGYTREYAESLLDAGASSESLAISLASEADKAEMAADAMDKLNEMTDDARSAHIQAENAARDYESELAGMSDVMEDMNELTRDGSRVWDEQAQGFDLASAAGRRASEAMTGLATAANDYLSAMIDNGSNIDEVTAKQSELRGELVEQATALTGSKDSAEQYVDSLLMTPEEITTKVNLEMQAAKSSLLEYINLASVTFPDDQRDYIVNILTEGVTSGEMDLNRINELVSQLDDEHTLVLDTNGEWVVGELEGIEDYATQLDDGTWQIDITANDMASGEVERIKNLLSASGVDWKNVKILLEAQDDASGKITQALEMAEAFGLTEEEIDLIANTDNASSELDGIRAKLSDLGLTDTQIDILLDAIDLASPQIEQTLVDAEGKASDPISFRLEADDTQARTVLAGMRSTPDIDKWVYVRGDTDDATGKMDMMRAYDGTVISRPWMSILGNKDDADMKMAAISAYNGVTIANPWAYILGNKDDAMSRIREVQAYNGVTIAKPWGRVQGDNSSARTAFREVSAYNGRTLATAWGKVDGNDDPFWSVRRAVANTDGSVIATNYVNVITRSSGEVRAASGGRIHGAGTSTSDSIPAWLSNGEMVIRAASVRKLDSAYGRGFLDYVNRMGELPEKGVPMPVKVSRSYAYADGGRARMSGFDVNVSPSVTVVSESDGKLVAEVRSLRSEFNMFRRELGGEIAANSSPWPSRMAFNRDVGKALMNR